MKNKIIQGLVINNLTFDKEIVKSIIKI